MPSDEGIGPGGGEPDGDPPDATLAEAAWDGTLPPEQAPPWYPALAELVAEARGPATAAELAGEDDAVAALAAAMPERSGHGDGGSEGHRRRRRRLLRMVTVKTAAAGAIVVAGAVAAAAAGVGPSPRHFHLPLLGHDRGDERPVPSDGGDHGEERGDDPADDQGDGVGEKAGRPRSGDDGRRQGRGQAKPAREHHPPGQDKREPKAAKSPKAPKVEKSERATKAELAAPPQANAPTGGHRAAGRSDRRGPPTDAGRPELCSAKPTSGQPAPQQPQPMRPGHDPRGPHRR